MKIEKISFKNFRNLSDNEIIPDENINVIWGNNAQGKTNLLEALWLFTGGHSFRGNKDSELVRLADGKNLKECSLVANFYSGMRSQNAVLNIIKGKRSSVINGIEKKNGSALVGKICAVIFSPEHLLLVKDGPQKRRNFIDAAICQIKPAYVKTLSKYNRALLQRNTLIKEINKIPELIETLDIWNERLVHFGALVMLERIKYIDKIKPRVSEIYEGISKGKEKLDIRYIGLSYKELSAEDLEESLKKELKRVEKSDLKSGVTSVGPHRDDIEFLLDGLSVRTYGSQGQQRSVVLSLKLSEADILEKSIGETPIILLDDVMSELDESRQDYLLNHLDNRQVFITCCSPETLDLMEKGTCFYVESGKITEGKE